MTCNIIWRISYSKSYNISVTLIYIYTIFLNYFVIKLGSITSGKFNYSQERIHMYFKFQSLKYIWRRRNHQNMTPIGTFKNSYTKSTKCFVEISFIYFLLVYVINYNVISNINALITHIITFATFSNPF